MDFARKQLEKYGWTDGKGLGKNENGISQALKPKLKRSVTGIGHDAAKDFTEHWWTQLYDKAAGNVQVEEEKGKTKKIKTKDGNFKISNSTYHIQNQSNLDDKAAYGDFFIRTAIMASDGTGTERVRDTDSESEGEKEKVDVFKLTDEELFAACEGRTAHKGARHGLKAIGKLARIERQEQVLLNEDKYSGYSHFKKKKDSITDLQVEDMNLNSDSTSDNVKQKKKKKKRKYCKEITCEEDMAECQESVEAFSENQSENVVSHEKITKKSKRKKSKHIPEEGNMAESNELEMPLPRNQDVKKLDSNTSYEKICRKSKKSKRKNDEETIQECKPKKKKKFDSEVINNEDTEELEGQKKNRKIKKSMTKQS